MSTTEFCGLGITYDDRVLEPRAWTQLQSRWAGDLLADAPPGPVLELCTGAGHIGLGVVALTGRPLVAVDLNPAAVELVVLNAQRNGVDDLVEARESRLEDAVADGETFALVVADPPWVRSDAVRQFPDDPLLAIDGGVDGLDVARACVVAAQDHLAPGGPLLLQLGEAAQADAVATWAARTGWTHGGLRQGARGVVVLLHHP